MDPLLTETTDILFFNKESVHYNYCHIALNPYSGVAE